MLFEWDERKAAQNVAKHGVPFEYAVRIFLDPQRLDSKDTRRDYGEERWLGPGKIEGRLIAVAYTPRGTSHPADFRAKGERTRTEEV
jgi:hypothetical protein